MSCCSTPPEADPGAFSTARYVLSLLVALVAWAVAYSQLVPLSEWIAHGLLGLGKGTRLGDAASFFLYDTPKILLLLVLMVYAIAWLRAGMDAVRIRTFLSGRAKGLGYVLAALFGAVSPFCSCSTIPLFIGFTSAQIPIGIAMAFLVTSPIINEVALVLLWGLLGWKFAVAYAAVGMIAGIAGGIVMDALRAERWLQPLFRKPQLAMAARVASRGSPGLQERHAFAAAEVKDIFRRVWLWVVLGVAIGAGLHGVGPANWFAERMG
ncbi:MAG: permease, partial [Mailhella sp.]|nr:permease [Mailhella sp.]